MNNNFLNFCDLLQFDIFLQILIKYYILIFNIYLIREGMVPGTLAETVPETAKDDVLQEPGPPQRVAEVSSHDFHKIRQVLCKCKL